MTLPVKVDQLQRALAEVATVDDALAIADQANAVAAAARAANLGLMAQNETAALRLHAERRLGELLKDAIHHGGAHRWHDIPTLADLGISKHRSRNAQRLADIGQNEFSEYLANTMASEKEVTQTSALKLLPRTPRPERTNIAEQYAAPPVDAAIAAEYGLEAADDLAEMIAASIQRALTALPNPRHAYVWAKYHGVQDDGTIGESWSFDGIAKQMGTSREYVEGLYYRASHAIQRSMYVDLLDALKLVTNA